MFNIIKDDRLYTVSEVENKWPLNLIIISLDAEDRLSMDSLCQVCAISDNYKESSIYANAIMSEDNNKYIVVRFGTDFYNEAKGGQKSTLEFIEDNVFYEVGGKRFANRFILCETIYDEDEGVKYRVHAAAENIQDAYYYAQTKNIDFRHRTWCGRRWGILRGVGPTNIIGRVPGLGYILDESCTDENGNYCERSD